MRVELLLLVSSLAVAFGSEKIAIPQMPVHAKATVVPLKIPEVKVPIIPKPTLSAVQLPPIKMPYLTKPQVSYQTMQVPVVSPGHFSWAAIQPKPVPVLDFKKPQWVTPAWQPASPPVHWQPKVPVIPKFDAPQVTVKKVAVSAPKFPILPTPKVNTGKLGYGAFGGGFGGEEATYASVPSTPVVTTPFRFGNRPFAPTYADPTYAGTTYSAYSEPTYTGQTTYAEPVYTGQTTYAQPAYTTGQTTYAEPAYTTVGQTTYAQPAYTGQTTYAEPTYTGQAGQTTYAEPAYTGATTGGATYTGAGDSGYVAAEVGV